MVSFQTIYDEVDYSGDEDDILKHILANNVVEDAPPFPPPKAPSTPVLVNNLEAKSSKAGAPALEPVGSEIAVAEKIDFLNADKRPFASNGRLAGCDENDSSFCAVMPPEKAPHDLELGTSVESHPCLDSGRSSRVPSGLSLTSESNREHPAFAALFAAVEMESGTYTSCRRGASTETSPKRASVSRDSRHPGQSRMRRPTRSSPLGSAADIMYSRRHQESRARQRYVYEGPSVRSGAISNCVHSERVSAPPVPWDVRPRHSVRNAALHEASLGQRRHSRETHRSNATLVGAKIVQNSSGLEPRSRLDVRPNSALDVTHGNFAFENRERSPTPRRQENSGSQRGGSPHGFDGSSVIGENWEFRAFNYSRGFVPDLRMSSATDRYYDTPSPVRDLRRRGQESSSRSTEESMGASRDHWRHINRHPDLEGNRWGKRRGSAIEVEKADSRSIHRLSTSRGGKFRDPIPMDVERDSSLSIKDKCPPNRKRPLVDEIDGVSQIFEPFVRGDDGKDRRNRTPPRCIEHLEEERPQPAKRHTRRERDHWMPMSSILSVDEGRPVKKPRVVDAHLVKERTGSRGTLPREHWRNACKMTNVAKAAMNGDAESIEVENKLRRAKPKVNLTPPAPLTKETPDADADCGEGQGINEADRQHDRPSRIAGGPPSSNPSFGSSGDSVRPDPNGAAPPPPGNRLLPASGSFAPPVVDMKSRLGPRLPRERLPPAFGTSANAGGVSAVSTNSGFRREIRICGMASAASAPSDLPPDPGPPCCFPSSSKPKISTTSFGGDRQSPVPRPTPSSVPVCVTAHPQVHSPPGILAPRAPAPGPTPSQAFDDSSSAERRIPPGVDLRTLVTASRAARESRQPDGPHEPPQEQATQRPTSSSSHWSAPQTAPAAGAPGIGAASLLRHAAAASQSDADGLPQTPASCSSRGLSFKGAAARQREKSRMIIRQ